MFIMMKGLVSDMKAMKNKRPRRQKFKKKLMLFAWHPDRVMDWCMSEGEERRWN